MAKIAPVLSWPTELLCRSFLATVLLFGLTACSDERSARPVPEANGVPAGASGSRERFVGVATLLAPLNDQQIYAAGTEDRIHFQRPSDVLAAWQRWQPQNEILRFSTAVRLTSDQIVTSPGVRPSFSDEAGAFMALWECYALAAWVAPEGDPPMLWALDNRMWWHSLNPPSDFGDCVRQQPEEGSTQGLDGRRKTVRGGRSADVLAAKFSDHLLAHRCEGRGPDDCLAMSDALLSLAPRHPRIWDIAQAIQADVPADVTTVDAIAALGEWPRSDEAARTLRVRLAPVRRALLRQWLYLGQRIRALESAFASNPPTGVLDATLEHLLRVSLALSYTAGRVAYDDAWEMLNGQYYRFASGWRESETLAGYQPVWADALFRLGMRHTDACAPHANAMPYVVSSMDFWRGVWLGHLKRDTAEEPCSQATSAWMSTYNAKDAQTPPQTQALASLAQARAYVGDEAHAKQHVAIVEPLSQYCPMSNDPWGICRWMTPMRSDGYEQWRRLPVRNADRFVSRHLGVVLAPDALGDVAIARLVRQVLGGSNFVRAKLLSEALRAQRDAMPGARVIAVWTHPRHAHMAFQIEPPEAQVGPQWLLIHDHHRASRVRLPARGYGQYDDGQLATLSDMDGDQRLEVWFGGEWGECDGEGLRPGIDCAATRYTLGGEVFGDRLGPYFRGSHPKPAR